MIERPTFSEAKGYTVGALRQDLEKMNLGDDEPLVVIIDHDAEDLDELEGGSVLDIMEFGGWVAGMRAFIVRPR